MGVLAPSCAILLVDGVLAQADGNASVRWDADVVWIRARGDPMDFFATCPAGFEGLLADELHALKVPQVRALKGQVSFSTDSLADAYRACLWSRLASRVMLVLGRGPAENADALYDTVYRVPWEDHIPSPAALRVDAHGTNAGLRNTRFTALRAKDAIADRMAEHRGVRLATNPEHPDLTVFCRLSRERATVGLDLTGEPLFHRGYEPLRQRRSDVPSLRPDYAAALLALGGWYRACRHESPALLALFHGTGTVAVEAAAEATNHAPGLLRANWGFTSWAGHDDPTWQELLDEADDRAEEGASRQPRIFICDSRQGAGSSLRQMLRTAGLTVEPRPLSPDELTQPSSPSLQTDLMTCDLSWLNPAEPAEEAEALGMLRSALQVVQPAQGLTALTRRDCAHTLSNSAPAQTIPTFIGRDEAQFELYGAANPEEAASQATVVLSNGTQVPVLVPQSDQFAKRLQKVARQRAKWARRELVSCYRVYDSDLPDYAVSIDLYQEQDGPGRWLQVSEYAAPKEVDPALAHARLKDVLAIAPRVLNVRGKDVFLHVRSRSRGGSQYAADAQEPRGVVPPTRDHWSRSDIPLPPGAHLIDEGGLTFEVNFSSRLDCGIFLDHRDTRAMLREMAKGIHGSKRFLNLFAYTGTATCYAADGGATHTTTVDMSRPSLEWAQRNMERNGFSGPNHEYVQADVLSWTREQRHSPNRWDLIFCDVPTFSNSNRMHGSWDVQRDHAELLITLSRLLIRGGTCVFSCNLRNFKPDVEALAKAGVSIEDITAQTIPEDFKRNPKVHHCYLVRRA